MSVAPAEEPPGFFVSLQQFGRIVLATAHNRLELFLVEVEEERRWVIRAFFLTLTVAILGLMTLIVGTFTLAVVFWEEHRLTVLVALGVCYLLGTLTVCWRLRRLLHSRPAFSGSLAELQKDRAWIEAKR